MKNADAADRSTPHPALAELHEIEEILREDSRGIADLLHENPTSQVLRRVYIKTLITEVEGHLYAFKQAILAFEEILAPRLTKGSRILLFSEPERMILRERQYKLAGSGAKEDRLTVPLKENLRFTFGTFQRALDIPVENMNVGPGYDGLIKAQALRNRLTHPKLVSSLLVSETDLNAAEQGVGWYFSAIDLLQSRAATESIFHRHFLGGPPSISSSVAKLVENGAFFSGPGYDFPVGIMKQIGRQAWFVWPMGAEDPQSARCFFANAFSSTKDGLDVELFHKNTGKIGHLLPIRRAITDKHKQRQVLQEHEEWKRKLNQTPELRGRIEAKAVEAANEFREVGLRDIEELGESFRNSD